ncbi:MAG TPA: DUF4340 domain-containing protein [Stellaceae bacterium]|jgi:hypothetical protein|nr:DUF4340 domain-containing protein [Stellaceae bacterium]
MQHKGLISLVAVTVVAVGLAAVATRTTGPQADPLAGKPVLPEVASRPGDIGRVALVHGDQKTTLLRDGEKWSIEERGNYPANATKVNQALLGLSDLTYVEPKTTKAASYPRLEVEDAGGKDSKSTMVTLADNKGALMGDIITGKHRDDQLGGGEGGVYVRKPGTPQSWLARGKLDLAGNTADWLDKALMDLPGAQVQKVVLTQADGASVTIGRDKAGDKLALANMPKDKKLKYDSILDDAAATLGGLQLDDVAPAKDFAFPATGVSHAQFVAFNGETVAIDLADKDGKSWAKITATGTGDGQKAASDLTAKVSPWIYALPSDKAKTLRDKMDDLVEAPQPKGS